MSLLRAFKIRKNISIGKESLTLFKDINFVLLKNESIAITGKSGSGKTTLLHILGGLDSLDSGEIFFKETSLNFIKISDFHKYNVGFIFQNFYLLEDETVWKNILMPTWISKKFFNDRNQLYQRSEYLLDLVGLLNRKKSLARNLSGGEKQRLSIARSLINRPDIILADEPTGNLDSETSKHIHQLLLNCVSQEKTSLIVVTHDNEFAQLCSKRFILKDKSLQIII